MKKFLAMALALLMALSLVSCVVGKGDFTDTDTNTTDTQPEDTEDLVADSDESEEDSGDEDTDESKKSLTINGVDILEYTIVVPQNFGTVETTLVSAIRDYVKSVTGETLKLVVNGGEERKYEILIGDVSRAETEKAKEELDNNGYFVEGTDTGKIVVLFNGDAAMKTAKKIILKMLSEGTVNVVIEDTMIVSSIGRLRDPCVILVDGVYYAYGTGWKCFKNTSGKLGGEWTDLGVVAEIPEDAETNYWAPEVHEYKGNYYMFTTYKSRTTGHRGCVIFKSEKPEGPFKMITNGHITPKDQDSIDGTFYIDEEGQPWMIYVDEWTATDDGIGRFSAAKLSEDFTHFVSEPFELFRADDAPWCVSQVTDGCWMYKCKTGELLMLWSSSDKHGYCVGIARSDNGRLDGNWSHDENLLYSKSMTGDFDGGHGMLFTSIGGQMYLSIHSPNSGAAGREETPVFIAVREENGTLVWDE